MQALVIARLTILEAIRRRILLSALLLGLAFLAIYSVGFYVMQHEAMRFDVPSNNAEMLMRNTLYNFLTLAGLYAVNFLAIAMGALVAADTLAGEIGSGSIQSIVAKPVRRSTIIAGKWLGFAALLALYLLLMAGGVMTVAYVLAGYVAPNPLPGIMLIYLESLLVMSVTLAFSSSFSALATGGVIFGLFGLAFIGGWVEQFGSFLQNETAVDIGIISSLIFPSESLWKRAAFEMTPSIAQVLGAGFSGPFLQLSVPSPLMIEYSILYMLVAVAVAARQFSRRDL